MNMVEGLALPSIQQHLDCSYSTVQRVAHRFVQKGPAGLIDLREDNGEPKIAEEHEASSLARCWRIATRLWFRTDEVDIQLNPMIRGSDRRVYFSPCSVLVQALLVAKRDLKLSRYLKRLSKLDSLVIDDIGHVPQSREQMEVLFTLLAEGYERGGVTIEIDW